MEKLYTTKEVSQLTGYALTTIQAYAFRGVIKGDKHGKDWRFTEEQIKEFLDKKKKEGSNV